MGIQRATADGILRETVEREDGVPRVVAMATDREGNFYEGAAGERELGTGQEMTPDTVFCIFSCTKAVAGVTVMQLVEEGVLGLDDPAKEYVPEISEIQVLEGFDDNGEPRVRPPRSDVTVRQLMLHTAGFGYDFFNEDLVKYGEARGVPSVVTSTMASLRSVLLFDPGERWEYGSNIDWVGKVVEGARGKRLGEVMQERVFRPLGMEDTGFEISSSMRPRRATIHQRNEDGSLTPNPDLELPQDPEQHMGGHALYGTVGDYMKFIRMFLNDGHGASGRVLESETAEVLGLHLHDQRRGRTDRPSGGRTRLGGARQPLLLDRPQERPRRFLGHPDPAVRRRGIVRRLHGVRDGSLHSPEVRQPDPGSALVSGKTG
jgi:methyl acetate hydrolase